MNNKLHVELSPELENFREQIEASVKPFVKILPEPESDVSWWQSKFGGFPYLPKSVEYPKNSEDDPLFLLAQINFAEVPPLEDFPEKGILQFYILNEDLYGVDYDVVYDTAQRDWRILYFPEPDINEENLTTDFGFLPEPKVITEFLLRHECYALKFEKNHIPTLIENCDAVVNYEADCPIPDELIDEYCEKFPPFGHKIGGVPRFVQNNQRPETLNEEDQYILLLQIDTDSAVGIEWGDNGAAHFFIKKSALKKLDFSEVVYIWECG